MVIYVLRRLLIAVPMLFGISAIIFVVSHSLPVDPVLAVIGEQAAEHPAIVKVYREKWGLDKPLPVQYVTYIKNLLHGDLGQSIFSHRPVAQDLGEYLPATVELSGVAILLSMSISIPLGILAAATRGGPVDLVVRTVTLVGVSMPIFWLALEALNIFYLRLGIAPGLGRLDAISTPPTTITGLYTIDSLLTGRFDTFLDAFNRLLLPALVLASWSAGLLTRITRASMLSILHQDFLRTARSKGLSERRVIWKHAFKNAIIPVITIVGLAYADLLSGAVMTETIFDWPGIGRYAYKAAAVADFAAILGVALLVALIYVIVNLVVDIVYVLADPRVAWG